MTASRARFLLLAMLGTVLGATLPGTAVAQGPGSGIADPGCAAAIGAAEASFRLPAGLLGAIAVVESGRSDGRGRAAPWPWTINVEGVGAFFPTKVEAVAAVAAARAGGARSIDVGCMQVNLLHHPAAFATVEDALDPAANASYAANFLQRLFVQGGSWPEAAASYHSATPGRREDYQRRVMAGWPGASRAGYVPGAAAGTVGQAALAAEARYDPAFRAALAETRVDRARWVAMGLVPASTSSRSPTSMPTSTSAARRRPGDDGRRLARLVEARGPSRPDATLDE